MNILSSILPGLRQLRAPLSAGALWLVCAAMYWPQIEDSIINTNAFAMGVKEVWSDLPSTIQLGAVAFTAYLLGSLSDALIRAITNSIGLLTKSLGKVQQSSRLGLLRQQEIELVKILSLSRDETLYFEVDAKNLLRRYLQHALGSFVSMKDLERYPITVLIAQRDLALMKLLKEEPEQYGEIDRLYGESDFRRAVAPPLVALSVVISLGFATPLPGLVGSYVALFFIMDGAFQRREANRRLSNALYLGYSSIPSVDAAVEDFKRNAYDNSDDWLKAHLRNEGFADEAQAISSDKAVAKDKSIEGGRNWTGEESDVHETGRDTLRSQEELGDETGNRPS